MSSKAVLMLGVSGMRGVIGQTLTPCVAAEFAAAMGQYLKQSRNSEHPRVVVGRDSRPSGPMIESAVVAGLVSVGCRVTRIGIVSTPGCALMVRQLTAEGGLMITASHNPIQWNGIKPLRHDGVALPAGEVEQLIEIYQQKSAQHVDVERIQPIVDDPTCGDVHVQRVLSLIDVDKIRQRKFKVVLDSVHGAGGPSTAALLRELGVELVHLYGEPTGRFPHTPEPTRENLTELCTAVKEHGADAGFAQDPDADRLAIVDADGRYLGEEYTLVLGALRLLERAKDKPGEKLVAANLSTSRMIDDVAAEHAATVLRTPVGEANVSSAIRHKNALAGGEGNGGIIWPEVGLVRDSLAGIGLVLELMATRGQPIAAIADRVPSYTIAKDKLDTAEGLFETARPQIAEAFADQRIDEQDGLRIDWDDRWVSVRPSNTEPIVRIIAEAKDEHGAKELIRQVRRLLEASRTATA